MNVNRLLITRARARNIFCSEKIAKVVSVCSLHLYSFHPLF